MKDLEQILQEYFNCDEPFDNNGKLTDEGLEAYSKLIDLVHALDSLGVLNGANSVVKALDCIVEDGTDNQDGDAINDLQEISSQAVCMITDKIDCDRFTAFEICQKWADEFTKKYKNHDWSEDSESYYDRIDEFINEKLETL